MLKPEEHEKEIERLQDLESYSILDSLTESDYDDLTAIAASICGTEISLISFVDKDRQWFKSHHGLDATETPKEYAFCAHAINDQENVFIIPDASKDDRFHDNPLVTGNPHVTFYAGVPLISDNGLPLGTLCVIDTKPKLISQSQIQSLRALGNQVMNLLNLRKTKLTLATSEKTYRELFERSANAELILKNNVFVECNDAAFEMLSYTSKTALFNVQPFELSPEKQPDGQLSSEKSEKMNNIAYETGSNRFEWSHVKSNGEVFPVEVLLTSLSSENPNDKTLHVVWRDITKEKKAQKEVNELVKFPSENPNPILRFNEKFEIIYKNAASTINFLSDFKIKENKLSDRVLSGYFKKVKENRNPESFIQVRNKRHYSLTLVYVEEFNYTNIYASDISFLINQVNEKEKNLEEKSEKLLISNLKLEKTLVDLEEKNLTLDRFAFVAAHDIKAPLNGIIMMSDLLSKKYSSKFDKAGKEMISLISKSSDKLKNLVDGLLEYSKCENVLKENKSEINLNSFIDDFTSLFVYEEKLIFKLKSSITNVVINKSCLEQVLINLVTNAIKYNDKENVEIEIGVSASTTHYEFYIQDNGPGIPLEHQEKIFGFFETLGNKDRFGSKGNGIGLATVKKVVEESGGSIKVTSEETKGSKFIFTFEK